MSVHLRLLLVRIQEPQPHLSFHTSNQTLAATAFWNYCESLDIASNTNCDGQYYAAILNIQDAQIPTVPYLQLLSPSSRPLSTKLTLSCLYMLTLMQRLMEVYSKYRLVSIVMRAVLRRPMAHLVQVRTIVHTTQR